MKRLYRYNLVVLFLLVIFMIPIMTKIEKNNWMSQFENRKLAEKPLLTNDSLISGEYFKEWDKYLSDHIYKRNQWIKSYTKMNMFMLKKLKVNNVVIGDEGYLFPFYTFNGTNEDSQTDLKKNVSKMGEEISVLNRKIRNYGGEFYFVGIPEQSSFHRDKYPYYFNNYNDYYNNLEKLTLERFRKNGIRYVDMGEIFRNSKDKDFYFKTDHHYNFKGAYSTYYEIIKKINKSSKFNIMSPLEISELEISTIPNYFAGTRNRALYYLYPEKEKAQIAYPKDKIFYEKYTNGEKDQKFYYISNNKEDMTSYNVYMGGDNAETVIKTNRRGLPNVLIFGDSFTNAIEPLLYYHFNETRILDLRHYNEMNLYDYIDKYKPDIVLMVRDDLNYANLEGNGNFKGIK